MNSQNKEWRWENNTRTNVTWLIKKGWITQKICKPSLTLMITKRYIRMRRRLYQMKSIVVRLWLITKTLMGQCRKLIRAPIMRTRTISSWRGDIQELWSRILIRIRLLVLRNFQMLGINYLRSGVKASGIKKLSWIMILKRIQAIKLIWINTLGRGVRL